MKKHNLYHPMNKKYENTPAQSRAFTPEKLIEKLVYSMEEEKLFKRVDLTIEMLAEHLGTNRTYLSRTVNQCFSMPFRHWLNSYRIEQSIQFMLQHPEANQNVIARESGFMNASAFNHKFKTVTGESPRLWLLKKSMGVID